MNIQGMIRTLAATMICAMVCSPLAAGEEEVKLKGKPLSKLITQLTGSNRGLQVRAARAIGAAPKELQPKIVPELIKVLGSERENDRFVAAQALGEYGSTARPAVSALLPLLEGTQFERNRAAASKAFGLILKDAEPSDEVEKVTQALIKAFGDKYEDVRRDAVTACGMIGPAAKSCIPHLKDRLGDRQPIRNAAAWACGRMGALANGYIDRLISIMHGDSRLQRDPTYMPAVPDAIGILGPVHENVVPNLVDKHEKILARTGFFVQEPWELMRIYGLHIISALQRIGPDAKMAVPYLNRLLGLPQSMRDIEQTTYVMNAAAAIGPDAALALPALKALQAQENRPRNTSDEAWKAFKDAAAAAVAAVEKKK
ncbi:HEAT repeat domain-containing protein [Planctomycetota bacterium]